MNTQPSKAVEASVIIIGNEILSGRTQDKNIAFLGERLNALGINLAEVRIVPDKEHRIIEAVKTLHTTYDYVFTTGGIGPTHDDITAESIANAFGVPIELNPEAVRMLEERYEPDMLNESRLRMARIPKGAILIENPISKAPGFKIENVYVLAGVPEIAQAMFESVAQTLKTGEPIVSATVLCAGLPEGNLAGPLSDIQKRHPDVDIGSYPYWRIGAFGTSVVVRGQNQLDVSAAAKEIMEIATELGCTPALESA